MSDAADEPPDFDRGTDKARARELERRFLEWAYAPAAPIDLRAAEVAHAVKCTIAEAEAHLEDLAARDSLVRLVDDEGFVFYRLPGRKPAPSQALVRRAPEATAITRPPETQATMGLVLNLVFPGVGSIVAGKTGEGIAQLVLFVIGLPLCFLLIGIPLCVAVWGWALSTGLRAVHESQRKEN
jgi:TM2 domain-containing membrane protein YozV